MAARNLLEIWVEEALLENNGSASVLDVAKTIWKNHSWEIENSGDLFYTWQYDYRWAATKLRKKGKIKSAKFCPPGIWMLNENKC